MGIEDSFGVMVRGLHGNAMVRSMEDRCQKANIRIEMISYYAAPSGLVFRTNDFTALAALSFLQANGIAVPQSMALISFDNDDKALRHHITSCDFNIPAVVQAMLDHILGSRLRALHGRRQVVEIGSSVIERYSTGKV
ncbi:MAG: hypothetical protein GF398_21855 [Chitinivibrionales bacterium]|nr:hypothetical protein [Chitinivibrionales bacterium]